MRAHFFEDGITRLNSHLLIRRRNYALEPAQILFEAFLDATGALSEREPGQAARM